MGYIVQELENTAWAKSLTVVDERLSQLWDNPEDEHLNRHARIAMNLVKELNPWFVSDTLLRKVNAVSAVMNPQKGYFGTVDLQTTPEWTGGSSLDRKPEPYTHLRAVSGDPLREGTTRSLLETYAEQGDPLAQRLVKSGTVLDCDSWDALATRYVNRSIQREEYTRMLTGVEAVGLRGGVPVRLSELTSGDDAMREIVSSHR
jgi:hypothetical protein